MGSKETKHKPLCGWSVAVALVSCASAFVVNWTMNGAVQSTEKKCCDYRIQTFKKWLLLVKKSFLMFIHTTQGWSTNSIAKLNIKSMPTNPIDSLIVTLTLSFEVSDFKEIKSTIWSTISSWCNSCHILNCICVGIWT